MSLQPPLSFESLLDALEAAGEVTRLRLLGLLSEAELTVSELVGILGQSQPRISRHLKLLVDAGLAERHREGAWAFFRLAETGGALARDLLMRVPAQDPTLASDRARLQVTREARRKQAAVYFAEKAAEWDRIRAMHAPDAQVEAAILDMVGDAPVQALLDLGAGTGRMLELLAPLATRAVGVDLSPDMLNLARARMDERALRNVQLRQGDVYAPPVERGGYDLVVVHQVLHFLDDPGRALREAAGLLRPGGRLIVVDFAAHQEEHLREQFRPPPARLLRRGDRDLDDGSRAAHGQDPPHFAGRAGRRQAHGRDLARARSPDHFRRPSQFLTGVRLMVPNTARLSRSGSQIRASFEFFPAKSEEGEATLWEAIKRLEPLEPDFVSVTYGAGGTTRSRTHSTVSKIARETYLRPAAHLTCVGASKGEVDDVIREYWDAGVRHIVALRGDPPGGIDAPYAPHPGRLSAHRGSGRGDQAHRRFRGLGLRLSREASAERDAVPATWTR